MRLRARMLRFLPGAIALLSLALLECQAPPPSLSPSATLTPITTSTSTSPQPTQAAATPTAPQGPPPTKTAVASPTERPSYQPQVEVVATGLEVPWALAFAPDGRLFFTERPGRVRVIENGQLQAKPLITLPAVSTGESGLMGLALDPQFAQNHYLYVIYTRREGLGNLQNRVSRFTVENGQAVNETTLLENIPGASNHDGGRLKFGPDGKLYITTGDAQSPSLSQDINFLRGKILRLNADGTMPSDNPFPGLPVYTFGHRNPQGLAWDARTGLFFSTEHGPVGNDEVNLIEAGRNYGWPTVSGQAGDPRFVDPILSFTPSVAPSGATFYNGQQLWKWDGSLFFTTLVGRHLHRVALRGPDFRQVETHEALYSGEYGRLRDVVQGPDGYLYFTTSNRDGRGNPTPQDDRILRIVPKY